VDEVVRSSVEETLNGLLDAGARYERKRQSKADGVTLRVLKPRWPRASEFPWPR
jgi:hypothetical protein